MNERWREALARAAQARAVLLAIPSDTGAGLKRGASFGPEGIRSASALIRNYHPVHDVNIVETLSIVDYGDLAVSPGDTERTYRQVEDGLAPLVSAADDDSHNQHSVAACRNHVGGSVTADAGGTGGRDRRHP